MKIGRNQLCPCGSGLKYKKCCLNKKSITDIEILNESNSLVYHNDYLHSMKVKTIKINEKLLNIYDNKERMNIKDVVDDYLEIMNYILNYASKHKLKNPEEIDDENLVSDFIVNVIYEFDDVILNLNKDDYDLNIICDYLEKLVKVIDMDDNMYENCIRSRVNTLFKLGNYELGEKLILDLIDTKRNSIYAYVELVDDYEMIGDLEKSKYYYDLGLERKDLDELDSLEERSDYFIKSIN